jgi:hypothetical protein
VPSQLLRRVARTAARWTFYGMVALLGMGCGLVAVGGAFLVFVTSRSEPPRTLEVRVDPSLAPDGGWRSGRTELTEPPGRKVWVEVSASKKPDCLSVLVETHWPPYWGDLEFELTDTGGSAPRVEVRGGTHEESSGSEWPDSNAGGLIRVSSADFAGAAWLPGECLVIQYELVSTNSGSQAERNGKVVLTRDDFR